MEAGAGGSGGSKGQERNKELMWEQGAGVESKDRSGSKKLGRKQRLGAGGRSWGGTNARVAGEKSNGCSKDQMPMLWAGVG